ncbi:sensor histidine kinase [Streptomonospora sediminis]
MNAKQVMKGGRATGYLLVGLPTSLMALVALPFLLTTVVLIPLGIGYLALPRMLQLIRRWGEWERRRACDRLGLAHTPGPEGSAGLREQLRDPQTWRSLRGLLLHGLVGLAAGLIGVSAAAGPPSTLIEMAVWWAAPVAPTFLGIETYTWSFALLGGFTEIIAYSAVFLWGTPSLADGYSWLLERALSPSSAELRAARLSERVEELSTTRAEALHAHGAELRRIERDLHDGTQARLVELAMRAGVAEQLMATDPEKAAEIVGQIRGRAEEAMTELRDVIRTMYPPILADRGLDGSVSALAARCPVPTTAKVGELGEVPASVQAAAYFVIAEALTNAAKHAQADAAELRVERAGPTLQVEISDDGVGGADAEGGSGLSGIRRRVAALDGTTSVVSPVGGPTVITVELPCES